jgi:hypothetical protein
MTLPIFFACYNNVVEDDNLKAVRQVRKTKCGSGGTGRRSSLRSYRLHSLGGSNPSSRTTVSLMPFEYCKLPLKHRLFLISG